MNSRNIATLNSTGITSSESSSKSRMNNVSDFNDLDEIGALIKDTRTIVQKVKVRTLQEKITILF